MAMKVFASTDGLGSSDVNEFLVNTLYAFKNSDTSRNSTAVAANDPDLSVTVGANKQYLLSMHLVVHSALAGGNFKWCWGFPSGTVLYGTALARDPGGGGGIVMYDYGNFTNGGLGGTNPANSNNNTGFDSTVFVQGILNTAATGGGFTLKWAQSASNANDTTLRGGSGMLLRRVS